MPQSFPEHASTHVVSAVPPPFERYLSIDPTVSRFSNVQERKDVGRERTKSVKELSLSNDRANKIMGENLLLRIACESTPANVFKLLHDAPTKWARLTEWTTKRRRST